ncbi:MAG: flagellin, partial [Planctomycetota bacterium]
SGAALAGATLHGEYATGASGLTAGTEFRFNLSYEDSTFSERLHTIEASVVATGGGGTFVTAQDLQDGLNAAAGSVAFNVSVLGNQDGTTNTYGQAPAFRITSVDPKMRAFHIADNGSGGADALGLLSMSGGGKGMGSTAFGAVGLFSLEHGSQQFARMSVSGSNSPTFGAYDNGPLSGNLQDYGRDVQVMLDGRRSDGFGLDVFASSPALTLRATLSTAATTDTLTSSLRYLQRVSAGDTFENLLGVGVSSASITGEQTGTAISEVASDAVQQGIYDTLNIEVIQFDPGSPKTKHGLAIQTGDSNSPFDRYVTRIREISLSTLGGGSSKTAGAGELVHQNEARGGYLSDLLAGNDADLIKDPHRAMGIIDRAIEQIIEERTHLGGVQNHVLKRTENALANVSDLLQSAYHDITTTDFIAETVNAQAAQMAITGATFALRRSNDLTSGILDLLR